jgi:hypothetical protein
MKKTILSALLFASLSVFAVEPPKFISDYNYYSEELTTEDGEKFICYTITDKEDWVRFNKQFKKMKYDSTSIGKQGLIFTYKTKDGFTVQRAWAWGYRTFSVF